MSPLVLETVITTSSSWEQVGEAMGIHRTTAMRRAKAAGLDGLLKSTKYVFGKAAGPMPAPEPRGRAASHDADGGVECCELPHEVMVTLYRNGLW